MPYFNQSWLDFTGRTLEEQLGNGWSEGVQAEDLSRCLETYRTSFAARQEFNMEYRLRRYDGEYRWVLDHGVPHFAPSGEFLGYIGSCVDITEFRRAAERIREQANLLDTRETPFLSGIWKIAWFTGTSVLSGSLAGQLMR